MRVSDKLRAAKELATQRNTRSYYAVDAKGVPVDATASEACSFCAIGALGRVMDINPDGERGADFQRVLMFLEQAAAKVDEGRHLYIINVNDQLGVPAVARMFDIAIAQAEAEERTTAGVQPCA